MNALTCSVAIGVILIVAKYPTSPKAATYDDLFGLLVTISIVVILFVPLFIMSLFHHIVAKIIASLYQLIIFIMFCAVVAISNFAIEGTLVIKSIGTIGMVITLCSIAVTLLPKKSEKSRHHVS